MPTGIYVHKFCSNETRKKISESNMGKHFGSFSVEHCKHIGEGNKGRKSWNDGLTKDNDERVASVGLKNSIHMKDNKNAFGCKKTVDSRVRLSQTLKDVPKSEEAKNNMRIAWKNRPPMSKETIEKIKIARARQVMPFKDSKIEIILQNFLEENNIIFEKHKPILGQPDIFIAPNVCIFADGDYWHANPERYKAEEIKWQGKSAQWIWNKDEKITKKLEDRGCVVLRFWENDIYKNFKLIENKIFKEIKQ